MHLLTLIVGTVLLPTVFTLKCYECSLDSNGTCTETVEECPSSNYQCLTTVVAYAGGSQAPDILGKSCTLPQDCLNGSFNYGLTKTLFSCCATDLCNNRADITNTSPNGKQCFSCLGPFCRQTLNCEGPEDHCFTATDTEFGIETKMKGCTTKEVCSNETLLQSLGPDFHCCQGNFCNSGSSTSAGLLLLVAPLSYFIIFS